MSGDLERRLIPRLVAADAPELQRRAVVYRAEFEFAEERARGAEASRRRAWFLAWALVVICAAQAAAIAIILPLKDVVPYTILVDRQTGYVEVMRGLETGNLNQDEALVHSMLAQYVLERETFDAADFKTRYERVALWSQSIARDDYVAAYKPGLPGSILDAMRAGIVVTATVKHVAIIDRQQARVRFSLTRRDPSGSVETSEWSALIGYRFTGAPMRMEDRLINPLGFQVLSYRRDGQGAPTTVIATPENTHAADADAGSAPGSGAGAGGAPGSQPGGFGRAGPLERAQDPTIAGPSADPVASPKGAQTVRATDPLRATKSTTATRSDMTRNSGVSAIPQARTHENPGPVE